MPALLDVNTRFRGAVASSDLHEAGLLIHIWDGTESMAQRWRGCARHEGDLHKEGHACIAFGDRWSASIIGKPRSPLFGGGGGVILRPGFNSLLCAYGADAGTRAGAGGCGMRFCDVRSARDGWCDGAPHHPEDLKHMLQWWYRDGKSYNEVIVDNAVLSDHLPQSIEAFLCDRHTHQQFLNYYGVDRKEYPLLGWDNKWQEAGKPGPLFPLDDPMDANGIGPREPTCI